MTGEPFAEASGVWQSGGERVKEREREREEELMRRQGETAIGGES